MEWPADRKLLVVGNPDVIHVGAHLAHAAEAMGLDAEFCDVRRAFAGSPWVARLNWWLRGRRPSRLRSFSQRVVDACRDLRPAWMLSTGIAPIDGRTLALIGELGVARLNYLTDDPWNPAHGAPWFVDALPLYDHVFSPRRANVEDLRSLGCRRVSYLPFAYAPEVHFPDPPASQEERVRFGVDVVFAGGADPDRVSSVAVLLRAGFRVALYGGYWERYPETRPYARGHADPRTLRRAIGGARVTLCLVRRANRDGHSMRTFEVPAIRACMLTEDTAEHRQLFGDDGEAVTYFRSDDDMVERLRWLLAHEAERQRLARAAYDLIIGRGHTYQDRLATMLGLASSGRLAPRVSMA